jgi:hypothetical protein
MTPFFYFSSSSSFFFGEINQLRFYWSLPMTAESDHHPVKICNSFINLTAAMMKPSIVE